MRLFKPFVGVCQGVALAPLSALPNVLSKVLPIARAMVAVAVVSVALSCPVAFSKDLSGRLGIGFTNDFSNSTASRNVPALSAKYGASKDLHLLGAVGFNSADPASFTLGGKVFKNIFYETNLNFFAAAGLAYLKDVKSGVELLGVLGCEFFVPGLDSLGFLFEAGVSASNVTGSFVLKTVGYTFIHAGMHFYF